MRAFVALMLVACGGRTEVRGTGIPIDASSDTGVLVFTCGTDGCNADDSYCEVFTKDHITTYTCEPLPPKCNTCSCTPIPKTALTCVCTSDGLEITVSCN